MPHVRSLFDATPFPRYSAAVVLSLIICWSLGAQESERQQSSSQGHAAQRVDYEALCTRPEIVEFFSYMVDQSVSNLEVAAFILRQDDGTIAFLPWPSGRQYRSRKWNGSIPRNAIAVAHTHPNDAVGRQAWALDRFEAQRIGLPIFIVTRGRISVVEPDTKRPIVLRGGEWRTTELQARLSE